MKHWAYIFLVDGGGGGLGLNKEGGGGVSIFLASKGEGVLESGA